MRNLERMDKRGKQSSLELVRRPFLQEAGYIFANHVGRCSYRLGQCRSSYGIPEKGRVP